MRARVHTHAYSDAPDGLVQGVTTPTSPLTHAHTHTYAHTHTHAHSDAPDGLVERGVEIGVALDAWAGAVVEQHAGALVVATRARVHERRVALPPRESSLARSLPQRYIAAA
jgi:ABC-type nickel/cobalt efflux system permease component RcnA